MIPEDFLQTLLHRLDIVTVVERYVPLKRAGANYVARCPFHEEKTPSFSVSPSKQFYHCFGCGAHGTAISFLMAYRGLSFPDAVQELASEAGLTVPTTNAANIGPRVASEPIYAALAKAAQYYQQRLKESSEAIAYLKGRGIDGQTAHRFGLGYAPAGWQNLAEIFAKEQDALLEDAGLIVRNAEGKLYDRFRGRLMFPIVDLRGRTIGFGGRVLGTGEPKYLNSPETEVFKKGLELYGFYQGREVIRQQQTIMVVEGYVDVIALHQVGIEYAVATLGTATTTQQLTKLLRHGRLLIFCFDGDAAGKKAGWRALETALPLLQDGKEIRFLFLPTSEDPDSFLRKFGRERFEALLAGALPLSDYLFQELSQRYSSESAEGAAAFFQATQQLLQQITAPALLQLLQQRLAQQIRLDPQTLSGLLQESAVQTKKRRSLPNASSRTSTKSYATGRPTKLPSSRTRRLLRLFLYDPSLAGQFDLPMPEGTPAEQAALHWLMDYRNASGVNTTTLLEEASKTEHYSLMQTINQEILLWGPSYQAEADFTAEMSKYRQALNNHKLRETLSNLDLSAASLTEQSALIQTLLPKQK